MRCKHFRNMFQEYLGNLLSKEQTQLLKSHLDTCDSCREEFQFWKTFTAHAKNVIVDTPPKGYFESFESRLQDRIRDEGISPAYDREVSLFTTVFSHRLVKSTVVVLFITVITAVVGLYEKTYKSSKTGGEVMRIIEPKSVTRDETSVIKGVEKEKKLDVDNLSKTRKAVPGQPLKGSLLEQDREKWDSLGNGVSTQESEVMEGKRQTMLYDTGDMDGQLSQPLEEEKIVPGEKLAMTKMESKPPAAPPMDSINIPTFSRVRAKRVPGSQGMKAQQLKKIKSVLFQMVKTMDDKEKLAHAQNELKTIIPITIQSTPVKNTKEINVDKTRQIFLELNAVLEQISKTDLTVTRGEDKSVIQGVEHKLGKAWFLIGKVYDEIEWDYGNAIKAYQHAAELSSTENNEPAILYRIGEIFYARGEIIESIKVLELICKKFPRHEKCKDAKQKLAILEELLGKK